MHGYCCTVNANSTEPGEPLAMQQQISRARKSINMTVSMGLCCYCILRIPDTRSDDVCWGISNQQQAAATTARSRMKQSQQQPVAGSRSRSSNLIGAV